MPLGWIEYRYKETDLVLLRGCPMTYWKSVGMRWIKNETEDKIGYDSRRFQY